MAAALADLLRVMISKQGEEKLTGEETDTILNLKSMVVRSSLISGTVTTGLVYVVTRKLSTFNRISLAGGAGFLTGYWKFGESLNSCIDYILDLDGSRMQHELRKIVLQRYGNAPHIMQRYSKHFYCEEVYNDSNTQYPRLVYRYRNTFMDDQRIANGNIYGGSGTNEKDQNHPQGNHDPSSDKLRGPSMENKQVRTNPSISVYGYSDPLEVLFGYSSTDDDIDQPGETGVAAKVKSRAQKKARRKQRMHLRHRDSLSLGEAQLLGG